MQKKHAKKCKKNATYKAKRGCETKNGRSKSFILCQGENARIFTRKIQKMQPTREKSPFRKKMQPHSRKMHLHIKPSPVETPAAFFFPWARFARQPQFFGYHKKNCLRPEKKNFFCACPSLVTPDKTVRHLE